MIGAWIKAQLVPGLTLGLACALGFAAVQYARAERREAERDRAREAAAALGAQFDAALAENGAFASHAEARTSDCYALRDSLDRAALQDRIAQQERFNRTLAAVTRLRQAGDAEAARMLAAEVGPSCEAAFDYLLRGAIQIASTIPAE